jgi:hypothetical protein
MCRCRSADFLYYKKKLLLVNTDTVDDRITAASLMRKRYENLPQKTNPSVK